MALYTVRKATDSAETLLKRDQEEFVLISLGGPSLHDACRMACDVLQAEPDVAAVASSVESRRSEAWDIGDALPIDALLCRHETLRHLLAAGFKPLVDFGELDCAFRHAGWRVQMTAHPFADPPPRQSVQGGRRQFARFLYDLAAEQLLAQGPRILKRTLPYHIWLACIRLASEGKLTKELGFLVQAVISSLKHDRGRLLRGPWRSSSLGFRFPAPRSESRTAVVMFTANRPWYLRRALRALKNHWPESAPLLVISQDGAESTTHALIESLAPEVKHVCYQEPTRIGGQALRKGFTPYYRIAQHFGHTLSSLFSNSEIERVIVLEDDIEISADFFPFMERLTPELERNTDLLALSAWNDHGQYASCPETVHRTDCFPGQGWMITRPVWTTLEPYWPGAFWDEWLRTPGARQGRQCLRPELNRVRNFGRSGTGSSDFFDSYIAPLRCQEEALPDNSVLELSRDKYESSLWSEIRKAKLIEHPDDLEERDGVIVYEGDEDFQRLAELLGIISTCHESGPRAAFHGVVILRVRDVQLFLVRRDTWSEI